MKKKKTAQSNLIKEIKTSNLSTKTQKQLFNLIKKSIKKSSKQKILFKLSKKSKKIKKSISKQKNQFFKIQKRISGLSVKKVNILINNNFLDIIKKNSNSRIKNLSAQTFRKSLIYRINKILNTEGGKSFLAEYGKYLDANDKDLAKKIANRIIARELAFYEFSKITGQKYKIGAKLKKILSLAYYKKFLSSLFSGAQDLIDRMNKNGNWNDNPRFNEIVNGNFSDDLKYYLLTSLLENWHMRKAGWVLSITGGTNAVEFNFTNPDEALDALKNLK